MDKKMEFILEQHGFTLLNGDYVSGIYQLIGSSWYFKRLLSQMEKMEVIDEWYQFIGMWLCDHESFVRIYDNIQLGNDEDDRLCDYLIYQDLLGGWARVDLNHMDSWLEMKPLLLDQMQKLHYENGNNDNIIADGKLIRRKKCENSYVDDMNLNENENYKDDEYYDNIPNKMMKNDLIEKNEKDLIGNNGNVIDDGNVKKKKCANSHIEDVYWNENGNENNEDEYYDEYIHSKMMKNDLIEKKEELLVNDQDMKLINSMEIHYYGDIKIGKSINNDINFNGKDQDLPIMDDDQSGYSDNSNDKYNNRDNNKYDNGNNNDSNGDDEYSDEEDDMDSENDSDLSEDSIDDLSDDGDSSDDEQDDENGFDDDNNNMDSNNEDEYDDDYDDTYDDTYDDDEYFDEDDDMDGDQGGYSDDGIMNLKTDLCWYEEGENMFKSVYLLDDCLFSKYMNSDMINNIVGFHVQDG